MRYRVIQSRSGELVTICNVAERDRAINISNCYPDSIVMNSNNSVIHIHTASGLKIGR